MKKLSLLFLLPLLMGAVQHPSLTLTSTGASVVARIGPGVRHLIQCDAAARIVYGKSTAVAAATDLKLAADQIWEDTTVANEEYIAMISVSGTTNCYVYPVNL